MVRASRGIFHLRRWAGLASGYGVVGGAHVLRKESAPIIGGRDDAPEGVVH